MSAIAETEQILEEQTSFLSRIGTVKELEKALGGLPFPPPMKPRLYGQPPI
jgi:hypothetical protein